MNSYYGVAAMSAVMTGLFWGNSFNLNHGLWLFSSIIATLGTVGMMGWITWYEKQTHNSRYPDVKEDRQ